MCCKEKGYCQKPENLNGKTKDCSAEKVRKCHGKTSSHPCAQPAKRN